FEFELCDNILKLNFRVNILMINCLNNSKFNLKVDINNVPNVLSIENPEGDNDYPIMSKFYK
ncbi:MAG: hypothetical protein U9N54_10495, partial [candidate division Zixibacteria bacterium]|nr:hypothetical protein [candidate division Zixibacteria bacterium]